ncbi:MAG: flagellar hook-length control protein FliK [Spirochaetaceae bacterium]|nr:flagellar hook-length control protein FliK [Spirochaetaceae bacterium]
MMASNIQLDLTNLEPVQASHSSSNAIKTEDPKSSSFAKELEKAMNQNSESNKVEDSLAKENVHNETLNVSDASEKDLSIDTKVDIKKEQLLSNSIAVEKGIFSENENLLSTQNLLKVMDKDEVPDKKAFVSKKTFNIAAENEQNLNLNLSTMNLLSADKDFSELKEMVSSKGKNKNSENQIEDEMILAALQTSDNTFMPSENVFVPNESMLEKNSLVKDVKLSTGTDLDDKIKVMDYRSATENGVTEASLKDGNFVTEVSYGEGTADITFNLASSTEKSVLENGKNASTESNFASMLSNQIQNNATEFVKTGSIILRDNNSGTINLVLHPEELGNVKISLEMNDKLVSARITVASEEAYQAFKESISSLKQAFAESGFQTGGFDLAWSGSGNSDGFRRNNEEFAQQQMFALAKSAYSDDYYNESAEDLILEQKIYSDLSQIAVNIMA